MFNFSIIIPTYNRPERLKTCLDSILRLNYQRDRFEVIVVDDGSKQPLNDIVEPYQKELNLTLIRQLNSGPATARNTGATAAKGKYLAFTDDDCTLDENWLLALDKGFSEMPDALLGGKTINALQDNLYSAASQLLIDYLYDYYNTDRTQATFFASNNFAASRELFNKIGQFDVSFPLAAGEDREFCDRWQAKNLTLYYVPDAKINHFHHLSLSRFWRQHFNYGQGAFYFHKIRAQRGIGKIKVEPISFYSNLLTYPLTKFSIGVAIPITCLFLLSQIANIGGFFWAKLTKNTTIESKPSLSLPFR